LTHELLFKKRLYEGLKRSEVFIRISLELFDANGPQTASSYRPPKTENPADAGLLVGDIVPQLLFVQTKKQP